MKIALDAMGSENAPREEVKGAAQASREQGVEVVLVGRRAAIEAEMERQPLKGARLSIVEADQVVAFSDHPARVVRDKQDSSIVVGTHLVQRGEASALVSAGHSGAVMAAALFILGCIDGVERPALSYLFTTAQNTVLLLDVGANVDCKPIFLMQFAAMGSVYMERVFNLERPRVGLLSNGEEATKGNTLVRETLRRLKESDLNFVGSIEGQDITKGIVDVVVTDGFTGNVVLKAGEGLGEMVLHLLQRELAHKPYLYIPAFFLRPTLRAIVRSLDYSEQGGVPLLGVNGNVVVAHGRSSEKAIKNAILMAKLAQERGVLEAMRHGITHTS